MKNIIGTTIKEVDDVDVVNYKDTKLFRKEDPNKVNTAEEIEKQKEERRESYNLLASFIPLLGVLVWVALILMDTFLVQRSLKDYTYKAEQKKTLISQNYTDLLLKYGEFVVKTQHLAGVVELDIRPEKLFQLIDDLFPDKNGYVFSGFSRSVDGAYSVKVTTSDLFIFVKVVRRFNNYDKIHDVSIKSIAQESTASGNKEFVGIVQFYFNISEEVNGQQQ